MARRTACVIAAALVALGATTALAQATRPAKPTPAQAEAFMKEAEAKLLEAWIDAERANWVQATYIIHDTETLAAQANARAISTAVDLVLQARRFEGVAVAPELARKLDLLRRSLTLPAPADPALAQKLTGIGAAMESAYSTAKYCPTAERCLDLQEMSRILATSRDAKELQAIWEGWRAAFPPLAEQYAQFIALANQGARGIGYSDTGALWRSKYDMPPDAFAGEVMRLWEQVQPLYTSLHAYVRKRLVETYGAEVVPPSGPIPAHLLGNMWAQSWGNIYDLVAPKDAAPAYDLTAILKQKGMNELEMVRTGERFFTSLGFPPLPETFWERSLFVKPADREVVCHASAWNIDWEDDLRLKMCIEINDEDFSTVHHELGHNFYQRAYKSQPALFRDSANDAFHEAIGDTIALSITPAYLVKIGLLEKEPPVDADLGLLLRMALDKVAFLPFGLLIDQWRWDVTSGKTPPAQYNQAWWRLREDIQGVAPPSPRPADAFDPGAKYHVPANVPYTRYFLAHILQFQFQRGLCQAAGYQGPLHRCSIYANAEAGARLRRALEMGASRPWPEALEALTGQRQMDATALLDYFAPLKAWLDEQNQGAPVGWRR